MKIIITKLEQGFTTTFVRKEPPSEPNFDDDSPAVEVTSRRAWEDFNDVVTYVRDQMAPQTNPQQEEDPE